MLDVVKPIETLICARDIANVRSRSCLQPQLKVGGMWNIRSVAIESAKNACPHKH